MPWTQVIRIFGFSCSGSWEVTGGPGRLPIQTAPFQYSERALRQYDFFMSACAQVTSQQTWGLAYIYPFLPVGPLPRGRGSSEGACIVAGTSLADHASFHHRSASG